MGITTDSLDRLKRHNGVGELKMCELGAQNLYTNDDWYNRVAKDYFVENGVSHDSYDIIVHQGCAFMDLREPIASNLIGIYDVVTDYGTTEHVDGNYYQACKNIHDLCKVGGLIFRDNPKTGNWIGHGCNYLNMNFYIELAKLCKYEILELTEHFAMGNVTDGCNICVALKKTTDSSFISEQEFNKLTVFSS
jgi:hypothetical protein